MENEGLTTMRNTLSILFVIWFHTGMTQVSIYAGFNASGIQEKHLVGETSGSLMQQIGFSIDISPFNHVPHLAVQTGGGVTSMGYKQEIDQTYQVEFLFLTLPILANYQSNKISFQGGLRLEGLVATSVNDGLETYRDSNLSIMLGLEVFTKSRISPYIRASHQLFYMLNYFEIDARGNFQSELRDIKFQCLTMGIKVRIYNKPISL